MVATADRKEQDMEALMPGHQILIILAFMLLFGYKRLPDAARSLGRSLRIFKTEMRAMDDDPIDPGPAPTAGGTAALPGPGSVAELEAEARAAEARAAEMRARADARNSAPDRPR
jgi:sec-independent protein translocase protein TatA